MVSSIDLSNQVALVTGASRGIGRSIALAFAEAGASVGVLATTAERADGVVREITAAGGKAIPLGADVAKGDEVNAAVEKVLSELGGIDLLVNNAGITKDGLFLRMSEEDFTRVVDVNLIGCYHFCRAVARPMTKARRGRIINVTSIVGMMGNAGQANYAAAKAGMIGLTKSLAKEFGGRGVTVNAIAPGFIATDMTSDLSDEIKEASLKGIPLGRFGEPDDIAGAALFLASNAASYITGQTLVVDGGMAM